MSKFEKLNIIYEDKNIIVVDKPANMLTIATEKEREKTLFHKVIEYEKKKNKNNKIFIVHRLDKNTSGIVVFAKNQKIKQLLQNNWDNLAVKRQYVAIVEGHPQPSGTIKSYLKENKELYVYSSNKKGDGKLAITNYRLVATKGKYSLLEIEIKTGRKNQIRVHMSDINTPIIGDKKYNAKTNPIRRLGLHANKLVLINPLTNKEMFFESDLPNSFINLFN